TEATATDANDEILASQTKTLGLTKADNLNPAFYDHVENGRTSSRATTNTGNTTLHAMTNSDSPVLAGFSCKVGATVVTLPVASLAPGASIVCTGTHSITQGDLDAGKFADAASASSTEATATDANDEILASQTKTLGLTKADNLNPAFYDHVGQVVTYKIATTHACTPATYPVTISDSPVLTSFSCKVGATVVTLPVASLAPGASIVCTGTHSFTQGVLHPPKSTLSPYTTLSDLTATDANDEILASQTKTLGLTKADSLNPAFYDHVGQVVTYTLTAKNGRASCRETV